MSGRVHKSRSFVNKSAGFLVERLPTRAGNTSKR
jgi:hypothetical protein